MVTVALWQINVGCVFGCVLLCNSHGCNAVIIYFRSLLAPIWRLCVWVGTILYMVISWGRDVTPFIFVRSTINFQRRNLCILRRFFKGNPGDPRYRKIFSVSWDLEIFDKEISKSPVIILEISRIQREFRYKKTRELSAENSWYYYYYFKGSDIPPK